LITKNKTILQLLQDGQKSGTAMAGPAVPSTTALSLRTRTRINITEKQQRTAHGRSFSTLILLFGSSDL